MSLQGLSHCGAGGGGLTRRLRHRQRGSGPAQGLRRSGSLGPRVTDTVTAAVSRLLNLNDARRRLSTDDVSVINMNKTPLIIKRATVCSHILPRRDTCMAVQDEGDGDEVSQSFRTPSSETLHLPEKHVFIRKGLLLKRGSHREDRYVQR